MPRGPPPQLLEVQHDRLVRAQQVGDDFFARTRRTRRPAGVRGTATAARGSRGGSTPSRYSSAVPCSCSSSVCRLRNAICSGSRGSTSDSSVNTCARLSPARSRTNSSSGDCRLRVDAVEQPAALPDRPADRHFAQHDVEDPLAVDADARILLEDRGQRPAALEADLEPQVVEAEHEAVGRALRDADREHARQAAADGEVLIRIEQRVDELRRRVLRRPCAARTSRGRRPDPRPAAG